MKISILTFGCKVNQYESQVMLRALVSAGYTACDFPAESDVIVINSCTVTAMSDKKVRQALHRCRRENPSAVIALTGCLPQAFPALAERLTDADILLGNSNRSCLLPDIRKFLSDRKRIVDIAPHKSKAVFEPMSVDRFYERTRAFIKIEDGCNRFCSFCIIPTARGRVRSKSIKDLKAELHSIAENGYKEVVLTGINLSAYGQDLGLTLCDAVETACAEPLIQRVRLGSLEPERMDENVVSRLCLQTKLCPQFHLSLQSGCDATLKRMNRHYTTEEYRHIVKNLRKAFSNAAITTDMMIGFPGETDEEFRQSLAFAEEIGFAKVHVFSYSRRPGTLADKAPDQVNSAVKEQRSRQLIETTLKTKQDFFQTQIGRVEPVLFEKEISRGVYEGYTENYTPVHMKCTENLCGRIVPVTLVSAEGDFCTGKAQS